jgi:TusA-related sulfurtransferase
MKKKIKALILFANPKNTLSLDFAKEKKRIKNALKSVRNKKRLEIVFDDSSTIDALRKHLLQGKYNIVHISSHGSSKGLILEKENGESHVVPPKYLAELLQKHESLECLIFNACHSVMLGILTSLDIPLTIAMQGVLADDAAIDFSRGFYEAVAEGKNYEYAYFEGCDTANCHFPDAQFQPKILKRGKPLREAEPDPEQKETIKIFPEIWFAKKTDARLSARNVTIGDLLVFNDGLEFRNPKSNLSITGIIGVAPARMGHDNNNNWVKVVYQNGSLIGEAYFADPSTSEAENVPSGGAEFFRILSRQFGLLSSKKTQAAPENAGATPAGISIHKGTRNVTAQNMTGNVIITGDTVIGSSRKD